MNSLLSHPLHFIFSALVAAFAVLASTSFAAAQESQPVTCVKRTATAKPPPFPAGPRPKAAKRYAKPEIAEGYPLLQPVCPEGEVPAFKEFRGDKKGLMKGNPLLAPEKRVERPGELQQRKVFRSFREVYRPRGRRNPPPPGPPPPGQPACDGTWWFGACYYYGSAGFSRNADGGGMTASIERPEYVNAGGAGHSLDEIAIQAGKDNGDIVELGWMVSSDVYSDLDPHIFVYHWIGGIGQCYDGCNWQQYSNTYHPHQNIASLVGREVYIGYVFYQGNWWAWFDNQWLGYFPGSEWNGKFTRSAKIQWFGEVASLNGVPPKTDMGNGVGF